MLPHPSSRCPRDALATGAGSFKRLLGGSMQILNQHVLVSGLTMADRYANVELLPTYYKASEAFLLGRRVVGIESGEPGEATHDTGDHG